jgi:hypothetical protein
MKKTTLGLLAMLFLTSFLHAQFTVNRIDGTPFTNNEIIEFTGHSSDSSELKFVVNNTSTQNLDFRIRCTELLNSTGAGFQLCWAFQCLPSIALNGVYPNFQNVINAGASTTGLNDSFKNFSAGDGVNYPMDFTFRFFTTNLAGATVGSSLNVTYRFQGPLSIEQRDKLDLMGIRVRNTMVNAFIGLDVQKTVTYNLVNMQGQRISGGLLSNDTNLDLSNLQSGIYILNFSNEAGLSDTVKIVKK